jgi:colanic acid biosynthesis glycosyl transferase WcaI
MHILLHDFGGYSFSLQLARELAKKGHEIYYLYGDSTQQVKRGDFQRKATDSLTFNLKGISLSRPYQKNSLIERRRQEIEYGEILANHITGFCPDVVISANTPLDAQAKVVQICRRTNRKIIYWLQDIIGLATKQILEKRLGVLGNLIGKYYIRLERELLLQSDKIILISDDFRCVLNQWGIDPNKTQLIQNWSPLDEMPVHSRQNPWSQHHQLDNIFCFLYAGVLGHKHNPTLLVELARHFQNEPDVRVVVVSEGVGADWLMFKKKALSLNNLMIYPFQPFEQLPYVLASADVLIALLEPGAGIYSVPSKVLTYLCAMRPLLLSIPTENLAARIVSDNQAGAVVNPHDQEAFIEAAECFLKNQAYRNQIASNCRTYAEINFKIERIVEQFEELF